MEKSSKRGKIPQSDWPLIMGRYEAGETLASIARTYDCSPPAISYVVSRSRARPSGAETPQKQSNGAEPQLIKTTGTETPANGFARPQAPPVATGEQAADAIAADEPARAHAPAQASQPEAEAATSAAFRGDHPPHRANGVAHDRRDDRQPGIGIAPHANAPAQPSTPPVPPAAAPANGDHRRTLHLSLGGGGGGPQGNGPQGYGPQGYGSAAAALHSDGNGAQGSGQGIGAPHHPELQSAAAERITHPTPLQGGSPQRDRDTAPSNGFSEARQPNPYYHNHRHNDPDGAHRKEPSGNFIDRELRARVDGDIAAFLAAFDAALVEDTQESRSALREATDRLLRAGARTRIELERLEARMPLPPRDNGARHEVAWRYR
jgi:hypothetical protein